MKSIAKKKTLITTGLMGSASAIMAADGSGGMQISDTMIFSFMVIMAIVFMMIIYAQINALKGILENKELWTGKGNSSAKKAGATLVAFVIGQSLYAQGGEVEPLVKMTSELYWIMIALNAFLLGIIISLYFMIKSLIYSLKGEEETEKDAISQFTASLTDAVPIENERDILMDHDYDGIQELDNNLPPWWKYGFYLTIAIAVIYLFRYHVIKTGDLQIAAYEKEMLVAEEEKAAYMATQANLVDEGNLEALVDGARLEAGKKVYMDNCQICHGALGEGTVGPNFTDKYWKHGGGISNIYSTIKVGVPEMGMISWESQLTPGQIHEVASYILTLEGTNPPNQKSPEGEVWEAEPMPEANSDEENQEEAVDGDQSDSAEEEKA